MDHTSFIRIINDWLLNYVPIFRYIWIGTIALGIFVMIAAFVLKKNSERRNSPWIVGAIGLIMIVSSGAQLIMSL